MPERPLPELTPEMLLSYGGMRELEGARAMQTHVAPSSAEDAIFEDLAAAAAPSDDSFNVSFDRDEGLDSELAEASFRTPAVGNRFNVLRPPQHEPFRPPPPQVIGGTARDVREVGRVGRFAILSDTVPGESPSPRPDFLAEARARLEDRMMNAPGPRQQPLRNFAEERLRPTAVELNAKQAEKRAREHETLPTAYDRLMGDDPFEDDLE